MDRLTILLLVTALGLLACASRTSIDQSTTAADVESAALADQDPAGPAQLDRSKPVPTKSDVLNAWQKRQDLIKTFRFVWTEQQTQPKGWLPNPRYPQHEWLNIPGLLVDRMLADGSRRLLSEAKVSSYTINEPIGAEEFR